MSKSDTRTYHKNTYDLSYQMWISYIEILSCFHYKRLKEFIHLLSLPWIAMNNL